MNVQPPKPVYQLKCFSRYKRLLITLSASSFLACNQPQGVSISNVLGLQAGLKEVTGDANQLLWSDSAFVLVDSYLFKDSTELQIITKELKDSEKCHSCSAPLILRRSTKSRDGKIKWKAALIDAEHQWGNIGHFYLEELEKCPELLFYKGGYSQNGNMHTWINAFRTEPSSLGRKEWSFSFMEGKDQRIIRSLDSLSLLNEFTSQGFTPVESRLITEGTIELDIEPEVLNLRTTEKEYISVWVKEDERSIDFAPKTKLMSLFYKLDHGNLYLDSVWQSNQK